MVRNLLQSYREALTASSAVREELKNGGLSFSTIAKIGGVRWQALSVEARQALEAQADAAKERYRSEMSAYRKTNHYMEYQEYLAHFKAEHGRGGRKYPSLAEPTVSSAQEETEESTAARLEELIPYGGHEHKEVWSTYLPHAIHVARPDSIQDGVARASLLFRTG